jgi:endonuclease/exonuclease/phosphatase family metal-dependent hydrolase
LNPDLVGYTFPTWDPHVRLDYLFVPQACVGRVSRCQVFSANEVIEASDHFPLIAELS